MECLLPYLSMATVPIIMVGLERMLDYRGVGLERFHCTYILYCSIILFRVAVCTYIYTYVHTYIRMYVYIVLGTYMSVRMCSAGIKGAANSGAE